MGNIYKEYKPPVTGGKYLKFVDGEPVRIRLMSPPCVFETEYEGKVSTKYAWAIWNVTEDTAQVLQLPVTGYRAVAAICGDDEYGDPADNEYDLKITRTGKGTDTKYAIIPGKASTQPSEEAQEELKRLDLIGSLKDSDFTSHVMWVSEAMGGSAPEGMNARIEEKKRDVVIEDIGDEPINLDDIPF